MSPFKPAIICVSGFLQDEGEIFGTYAIKKELKRMYSPEIAVYDVKPWNYNMKEFARLLKNDGITHVIGIGYSWGGGYGLPNLCDQLVKHGIEIELVLLCDAVYRPKWLPAWGVANLFGFRAIVPNSASIKYPKEVKKLAGIRQVNDFPRGHPVKIGDGEPVKLPVVFGREGYEMNHCSIDESREWDDLVFSEVAKIAKTFEL